MNLEKFPPPIQMTDPEQVPPASEKRITPKRLRLALEANLFLAVGKIKVEGEEKLEMIPPDKKVIFITTHISDVDVPVVSSIASRYFDIAIANQSVHHSASLKEGEPATYAGLLLAGKDNFLPVSFRKQDNGEKVGKFDPRDYVPMVNALKEGKALIIAGHSPTQEWKLPDNPGYGAAYLSQLLDDVILVPVSVNLESDEKIGMAESHIKNFVKKPNASVKIGDPFTPKKIAGIENFSEIFSKRRAKKEVSHDERTEFSRLVAAIKSQAEKNMDILAANLPEDKRGRYGKY